ncbi:hypothetical protein GCM10012285_24270 [Streptomyces kronopolitis]|uniref:Uncharacterized protein n=1 Tax=Streptomyces kronopolitis TaxID=1612435 RepID=A0ABQ2JBG1_9ACTN|nr:hypothetical protein GCM10012285_24270 [Streptomyces kronopolitis]
MEPGLARGRYDDSGVVRGRYMCRASEQDLILRAVKPTAKQQPHFRHRNSQECPASAERRRQVDLEVVIDLRDRLMRAWPGVPICLELPQDPQETEPGQGPPAGLPPGLARRRNDSRVVPGQGPAAVRPVRQTPRPPARP